MDVLTLRRRLTLLVAMTIIVPITAVGVTVVNLIGNEVDERAFDRLRQGAAFAAALLGGHQADVERIAQSLAADPRLAEDAAAGGEVLEGTLRRILTEEDVDVAVVATAEGDIVGSARRDPSFAEGVEVPDEATVINREGAGLASVERQTLPSGGSITVGRWLDTVRLGGITRSEEVGLSLVAGREIVASTVDLGELPDGPALFGDFEGDFAGQRRFASAAPSDVGLTVLATARPPAGQSRTQLIVILGGLLLMLAILTALVGSVVSGMVTGPVEQLMDAALSVSEGDLTRRVDPAGDIELSRLGQAFNKMTDNLQTHVEELEQSRHEFQAAMARLGDVLVSTHDIGGIIDVVLEACTLTLRVDQALFFERVAMPAKIRATAAQSWLVPNLELNGNGIAGAAARELAPVLYPGPEELAEGEPEAEVAMAVPVVSDGRLYGVIAVYGHGTAGGEFREEDVHTLQTLARQTEVAIGNVFLHDETRRQARTDGTTGLWNRREFELRARETVKEAKRFEEPFGVILVDIDNFKQVNDKYDHSTGDAALIHVASVLSAATREIDVVARWGGEEFIVLLPRAGVEETEVVAERVRSMIEAEPVVYESSTIPLTVSIGYAVYDEDGGTSDGLFKAADAALLRAKRNGKNRAERALPGEAA